MTRQKQPNAAFQPLAVLGQSAATTEARAQAPQHEETCWRALRAEHIIHSVRVRSKTGMPLVALTPIEKLDRQRYSG